MSASGASAKVSRSAFAACRSTRTRIGYGRGVQSTAQRLLDQRAGPIFDLDPRHLRRLFRIQEARAPVARERRKQLQVHASRGGVGEPMQRSAGLHLGDGGIVFRGFRSRQVQEVEVGQVRWELPAHRVSPAGQL